MTVCSKHCVPDKSLEILRPCADIISGFSEKNNDVYHVIKLVLATLSVIDFNEFDFVRIYDSIDNNKEKEQFLNNLKAIIFSFNKLQTDDNMANYFISEASEALCTIEERRLIRNMAQSEHDRINSLFSKI